LANPGVYKSAAVADLAAAFRLARMRNVEIVPALELHQQAALFQRVNRMRFTFSMSLFLCAREM